MSTARPTDPRHQKRIDVMQQLFAYQFHEEPARQTAFLAEHPELAELVAQLPAIDTQLQALAPERPLSQINKVDLAVLQTIVFEWTSSLTPKKVLIDEGVELAKAFGTESSPRFVNGVLAQLLKQQQLERQNAQPDSPNSSPE